MGVKILSGATVRDDGGEGKLVVVPNSCIPGVSALCHYRIWISNVSSGLCVNLYCKYSPSFCNLSHGTNRRGGGLYARDATFSLAITPSLPVPRPQFHVEDNTFDDFAVAIWKNVIYTCGSPV